MSGEWRSADHESAVEYSTTLEDLVNEHEFSADRIYNADETALYWRYLPTSILASSSEAGIRFHEE